MAIVGSVWCAIRIEDLSYDQPAILALRIRVRCYRFEKAVRAVSCSLLSATAIECPFREFFDIAIETIHFNDFGLTPKIGFRLITVQPDVLKFQFCHRYRI